MFSWMGKNDGHKHTDVYDNVTVGLQNIYKQKLLPLEKEYNFHDFHSPALEDPDFDARPMVMLVGQYSTGKTTFIRYLLEQDFPGIRIGPEPTTDRSGKHAVEKRKRPYLDIDKKRMIANEFLFICILSFV